MRRVEEPVMLSSHGYGVLMVVDSIYQQSMYLPSFASSANVTRGVPPPHTHTHTHTHTHAQTFTHIQGLEPSLHNYSLTLSRVLPQFRGTDCPWHALHLHCQVLSWFSGQLPRWAEGTGLFCVCTTKEFIMADVHDDGRAENNIYVLVGQFVQTYLILPRHWVVWLDKKYAIMQEYKHYLNT